MTVRKGEAWGDRAPAPDGLVIVRSDAEARSVVEGARRAGSEPPPLGLLGGDLCRTLGGRGNRERLERGPVARFEVDVVAVLIDGRLHWFVAHLVARRSWLRGRAVVAMNAAWHGRWLLGPRAHPGDGLVDLTDGDLPLGQRWEASRRARTGGHLPHPDLRASRVAAVQVDLDPPLAVWLDGERVTQRARTLSLRIEPAALTVVV